MKLNFTFALLVIKTIVCSRTNFIKQDSSLLLYLFIPEIMVHLKRVKRVTSLMNIFMNSFAHALKGSLLNMSIVKEQRKLIK